MKYRFDGRIVLAEWGIVEADSEEDAEEKLSARFYKDYGAHFDFEGDIELDEEEETDGV